MMSQLSLFRPEVDSDEPTILPFRIDQRHNATPTAHFTLARAKTIHQNQSCPECHSAAVDPIELNDGLYDRFGRRVPGTATVVAFHCNCCKHEWSSK